jgi:hypothetical protein
MKNYPEAVSDNEWQAECDARTLADAEVIHQNPERMNKAKAAATRMANEKQEEAEALKKIGILYDHPTSKKLMDSMK